MPTHAQPESMRDLPTGTVVLFTDIAGSTRLLPDSRCESGCGELHPRHRAAALDVFGKREPNSFVEAQLAACFRAEISVRVRLALQRRQMPNEERLQRG